MYLILRGDIKILFNIIMDILNNVPQELKRKILSFHVRPPHYFAIQNSLFPISDSILFEDLERNILKISLKNDYNNEEIDDY